VGAERRRAERPTANKGWYLCCTPFGDSLHNNFTLATRDNGLENLCEVAGNHFKGSVQGSFFLLIQTDDELPNRILTSRQLSYSFLEFDFLQCLAQSK